MVGKFKNLKCEIDGITFDSQFERNIYLILKMFCIQNNISVEEIKLQHRILIRNRSPHFPSPQYWKVDFYFPFLSLYIEAKGVRTDTWIQQLKMLDSLNPAVLDNLIIVSKKGGERIATNLKTSTEDDLRLLLRARLKQIFISGNIKQ